MKFNDPFFKILGSSEIDEASEILKAFFETNSDAVCILDHTNIVECNTAAVNLFDANITERLISSALEDFMDEQFEKLFENAKSEAYNQGKSIFEAIFYNFSKKSFWAKVSLQKLRLDGKNYLHATIKDISLVKSKEASIKQNSPLEKIGDSLPNIMLYQLQMTPEGIFTFPYVSRSSWNTYNLTAECIMQDAYKLINIIHPDDIRTFKESLHHSAHLLQDWAWEGRVYLDGKVLWIRGNARPEKMSNNNILWNGALVNITAQKEDNEEIKILSLVASKTDNGVIITNRYGLIEWTNASFSRITEYTTEEVKGKKPSEILQGKETDPEHVKNIKEGLLSKKSFTQEILNYTKSGKPYWISLSITPILNEYNEVTRFIAIQEDITERKMMQEALHTTKERLFLAIEGSNDGIWDWDIATGDMYFSPKCKTMLGYEDHEIPNSLDIFDRLVHPDDLPLSTTILREYLKGKRDSYVVELRMRNKEGNYQWILIRGVVLRDKNGSPYRMAGSHTDITSVKTFEANLQTKNDALASSEEELRQNMEELQATQEALARQKEILEIHNKKMLKSIQYAKTIQTAILPADASYQTIFNDSFLLYSPKDIVSGDFYWCSQHGDKRLAGIIDCTGHGVPGAFMSMIGHSILNELIHIKGIITPNLILNELHLKVRAKLNQDDGRNKDGMDLGFCLIEPLGDDQFKLTYAGARHILYYIKNNELIEIRGDRKPIGGIYAGAIRDYSSYEVILSKGDMVYLITDGYADQANPQRDSFGNHNLKLLFELTHTKSMEEQKHLFESTLADHQQYTEQRDDITLFGFRI